MPRVPRQKHCGGTQACKQARLGRDYVMKIEGGQGGNQVGWKAEVSCGLGFKGMLQCNWSMGNARM